MHLPAIFSDVSAREGLIAFQIIGVLFVILLIVAIGVRTRAPTDTEARR